MVQQIQSFLRENNEKIWLDHLVLLYWWINNLNTNYKILKVDTNAHDNLNFKEAGRDVLLACARSVDLRISHLIFISRTEDITSDLKNLRHKRTSNVEIFIRTADVSISH